MNKIDLLKNGARAIVSTGVTTIITNAVMFTTPAGAMATIIPKVCIGVSSIVLGAMVSEKATEYTDKKIDDAVELVKKTVEEEKEKSTKKEESEA